MTLVFYLFLFLPLAWIYGGYIIFLSLLLKGKKSVKDRPSIFCPKVEIIIPCFNEENLIKSKIQNLLNQDYPPQKLSFTFVDGGSTDNTVKLIKAILPKSRRVKLLETNLRNKIKQINYILPHIKAEIIGISDVDTKLEIKTVKRLVQEFLDNPQTAVVGAHTVPKNTIPLDRAHWQKQNEIRLLESRTISSSSVVANCYLFRKNLLNKFPEDVIADDVYIAFLAQSSGLRVVYNDEPLALELRSPQTIRTFSQHKFRKAHANITETFRFLQKSFHGNWTWKLVYFTKLLQVVGAPLIILAFLILTIFLHVNYSPLPILAISSLLLIIITASLLLQSPSPKKHRSTCNSRVIQFCLAMVSFSFVNLILFSALLMYPVYKQTSSYKKII